MRKTLMAASVLALLAGSASAATVSYTGTTGVSGAGSTMTLQQFDSSLGTLTGIAIEWASTFNGTFRVVEDTQSGTASAVNNFVSGSIFTTSTPAGAAGPSLNSMAGVAFSTTVAPTYNQLFAGGQLDSQSFGSLASFVGLGTVGYGFFGTASATATVSDGLLSGIVGHQYLVNAEITYTYTTAAVPVPAALPLLAAAFGALGLMRLRRKA
jgi:hypothetical protein